MQKIYLMAGHRANLAKELTAITISTSKLRLSEIATAANSVRLMVTATFHAVELHEKIIALEGPLMQRKILRKKLLSSVFVAMRRN